MKIKIAASLTLLLLSSQSFAFAAAPAKKPHQKPVSAGAKKPTSPGSGANWNSGLSNMMDQLQNELGPKGSGIDTSATPPESEIVPDAKGGSSLPPGSTGGTTGDTKFRLMDSSGAEQFSPGISIEKVAPSAPAAATEGSSVSVTPGSTPKEISSAGDNFYGQIQTRTRWGDVATSPITVYVERSSKAIGFQPAFTEIVVNAFKEWSLNVPKIQFKFVDSPANAQIACTFTDKVADLSGNQEGGNTLVQQDVSSNEVRADVKILVTPRGGMKVLGPNYLHRVALHEVGHALGLGGHSDNPSDVMFGTVYLEDKKTELTARDINTLKMLYDQPTLGQLDTSKVVIQGDPSNPRVRALKLNLEGAKALQEQQLKVAEAKWTEALKLDPTNKAVASNLGSFYANLGSIAAMTYNFPLAALNLKKALPLVEKGENRTILRQVLTNYATILRSTNNSAELKVIEAKLKSLGP